MMRALAFMALLAVYGCQAADPVLAREVARGDDPAISAWFGALMQPDNPYMSCCGEADAYWADSFEVDGDQYVAIITDERPNEWVDARGVNGSRIPRAAGTRLTIPNGKIKWDKGNPTGHGIVFIGGAGQVYCYLPPGGV